MLQTLWEHQQYAKYSKSEFYKDQLQYIGHVIAWNGIIIDPEKGKTITKWHVRKNVPNIISFMGLFGYYHHFIEGFSRIA